MRIICEITTNKH